MGLAEPECSAVLDGGAPSPAPAVQPNGRRRVRTDPGFIRQVLADTDATTTYMAGKKHGLHPSTIARWLRRREREGSAWPTDADIAAWRADNDAHRDERRRAAAHAMDYRKRVYLNRGPVMMPPHGVVRRLEALMALGWTQADLAEQLEVTTARVGHMMCGTWESFHPDTVARVCDVYERLCMVVPTDKAPTKRGEIRRHARTRRRAEKLGYAPPLAWDDIDTDEQPWRPSPTRGNQRHVDEALVRRVLDGEVLPTTTAERRVIMAAWLTSGRSENSLCERMGWKPGRYGPDRLAATG